MPSSRHLRAVRSASVAAILVAVAGASVLGAGSQTRWPYLVSEVGWLAFATFFAAVTLRPVLYVGFATANAGIVLGLVTLQSSLEPSMQWGLGGLLGLLFVGGAVVAWQRRRLAHAIQRREAELRAAEREAKERAAAAEAARERLERAHTDLMTRSRTVMIGELSTAIGHEINNPLTAIVMASEEIVTLRPSDDDVRESVQLIRDAAERCREVVSRLVRHADFEEGTTRSEDLAAIASDALGLTRRHLEQRGASIESELHEVVEVLGNASELRQVVFNLLVHVGSRSPSRVVLRGGTTREHGWLAIRHDGGAMAEDQRATAFQPLVAGAPNPMIGLSLCRALVQRHQGRIALTPHPRGCTFTVTLPRAGGAGSG